MEDPAEEDNAPGNLTLHCAVECGKKELVVSFINDGADVNALDDDGNSVLFYAVKEANLPMVELLLNHKADVTSPIILNTAVKTKNLELLEYLLDHGANITASDQLGRTVLHEALHTDIWINDYFLDNDPVLNEFLEFTGKVTKLLLQRGAHVNAKTNEGSTPLHAAAMMGCTEAIQVLLDFHADVHARNANGETPLEVALRHSSHNHGSFRVLLRFGDGVNSKDKNGKFLFHMAAKRGSDYAVVIFLEYGANVNGKDDCGKTALHYAAEVNNDETVEHLLRSNAFINCRDAFNETPLHIASFLGHHWSVGCLLEYGADVSALCSKNETALDKAIRGSCIEGDVDRSFFDDILIALKWYIVKGQAANFFVRPQDIISVGNFGMKDGFRESCKAEIEKLRTEMICNVSYYDILTRNGSKLCKITTNDGISEVFSSCKLDQKFPIYAQMLRCQFTKLRFRARLMKKYYDDVIFPFLSHCFPKLPLLCTDIILTYLDNDDLIILIQTWDLHWP